MRKFFLAAMPFFMLLMGCGSATTQSDAPVHSVMLVQPQGTSAQTQKSFSGVVEESRTIGLGFKTGGQIASLRVKEGDYVRQGQLIATLDDADYKLAVEAARIQYEQTQREVARLKKLYEAKSITGNDYDKAVSGLDQLKVQLQTYENQLSYTHLYAPTSGYVEKVNFEVAETVGTGTSVINLLDVNQMEITFNMPASLYMHKDDMLSFTCSGPFSQGAPVELRLLSITPKADNNQLYRVRLGLNPNTAYHLTSGMNVEVQIEMNQSAQGQGMTVPVSSLFQRDGQSYVWVLDAETSTVNMKAVSTGDLASEGQITIIEGLDGSEQIVKAGAHLLQQGEKVKVIDDNSATNVGGLI